MQAVAPDWNRCWGASLVLTLLLSHHLCMWPSSSHLNQCFQMWVPEIKCLNPYSDIRIVGHPLKVAKQPLLISELAGHANTQWYHLWQASLWSLNTEEICCLLAPEDELSDLKFLVPQSSLLWNIVAPHWAWVAQLQQVRKMPQTALVKETAAGKRQNRRPKQARASESPDTQ